MSLKIPAKLLALITDQQLNAKAVSYIERSAIPSTVPNGRKSFTVRYALTLTNEIVEVQSRDIEFACLLTLQADPNVAYIIAQPEELELDHPHPRVRQYAPDFLVFYRDGRRPVIIETKPRAAFAEFVLNHPDRYTSTEANTFDMPLARKAADELGFDFRAVHEGFYNETFLRNILFLESYRKWNLASPASEEEKQAIKDQIEAQPGIKFTDIVHESTKRRADLIHHMLANGAIFMHMSEDLLVDQNRVALYATNVREKALAIFNAKNPPASENLNPYILFDGLQFTMGRRLYTIVQSTGPIITIRNWKGQDSQQPIGTFVSMLPKVDAFENAQLTKEARLRLASDKDLAEMLRRFEVIRPYVARAPFEPKPKTPNRTVARYLAAYRLEEAKSNNGFLGLLSRTSDRGSKKPLYSPAILKVMDRVITQRYLCAHPRHTMKRVFEYFERLLQRLGHKRTPSYHTFTRRCERWDEAQITHRRWGARMAKQLEVPSGKRSPLGNPHGERPFSVGHSDHTTNDLALSHPGAAKQLLKCFHTPMVDATTNRVIAHVTRHHAPSTLTLIALLKDCIRRNHTLPTCIVVDWGADNRSEWLQQTLGQMLGITIIYRQVATGASGSPVEGKFLFNDVTMIHQLSGSTEALKRARLTTGAMKPNKHAIWSLADLQEEYEEHYATFNSTPYGNAKISPDECEKDLSKMFGDHPRMVIPMEVFDKVLQPFVPRIKRTVDKRGRIFVGRTYYANDALQALRGKRVYVRQKPDEPRVVIVSHPDLPNSIECEAVSNDVKYATTPEKAHEAIVLKNLNIPEVKARKNEAWGKRAEARDEKEKQLRARKRESEKAQRNTPSSDSTVTASSDGKVVPFHYTQGGLKKMLGEGGAK